MPRTTWPTEKRAEALALYVEHGSRRAAEVSEVPAGTIRHWAHEEGLYRDRMARIRATVESRNLSHEVLRSELREELLLAAGELVAAVRSMMREPDPEYKKLPPGEMRSIEERVAALEVEVEDPSPAVWSGRDARDLMVAAGIALDKYRLEMGEATGREETLTLSAVERGIALLEAQQSEDAAIERAHEALPG